MAVPTIKGDGGIGREISKLILLQLIQKVKILYSVNANIRANL